MAAEIPDFRPQDHLDAKRAKRLDRFSQLAVTSAGLALADAAIAPRKEDPDRAGAMMGSALGGVSFAESQVPRYLAEGPRGLDPFAGAGGLLRRRELQHGDRVRLHRSQCHERDELCLGDDRRREASMSCATGGRTSCSPAGPKPRSRP